MTKGLVAIAYTAGAVAELASKTFPERRPGEAEQSKLLPKLQKDKSPHTASKIVRSRSRTERPSAGKKRTQR
jgi:hypothetical protein